MLVPYQKSENNLNYVYIHQQYNGYQVICLLNVQTHLEIILPQEILFKFKTFRKYI
jgi:hypothetical protein